MKSFIQVIWQLFQKSIFILVATSTIVMASNNINNTATEPTDSPARKVGNLVFISGQGTGSTKVADPNGIAIKEAFQKIRVIAKQMGGDMNNVVKLTVYMADLPSDYLLLSEIVPDYFHKPYPARSTVGVASLPKDHRIEIDAVMVLSK